MATLNYNIIGQLINLPEDNSGKRLFTSLMASLGINAVTMVGIGIANILQGENDHPDIKTVAARSIEMNFEAPKPTKPEVTSLASPLVAPTPKPPRPTPTPEPKTTTPVPNKKIPPTTVPETSAPEASAAHATSHAQEALSSSEASATVTSAMTTHRPQPTRQPGELATTSRPSLAASPERADSARVIVGNGNNLDIAAKYRLSDIASSAHVSSQSGGAVHGGSNGAVFASVSATTTLSTPTYGGQRGPARRNTDLIPGSSRPGLSAMSDEGRAGSGPAFLQGKSGSPRFATMNGTSGVSSESAGPVGVGRGGPIETSTTRGASVTGGTASSSRPLGRPGKMAEGSSKPGVGASGGDQHDSQITTAGGSASEAAKGTSVKTGGSGGGPSAEAGKASSGSGGVEASVAKGEPTVEANKGTQETKKPHRNADSATVTAAPQAEITRNEDAKPLTSPSPELSAEMKRRSFKASVKVQVTVEADGSHEEKMKTGTNDPEVDALILRTMANWKWRSAIKDGKKSRQILPYSFEIKID